MPAFVQEQGIGYPVAIDVEKKTTTAFQVDSFPDYYLIDRAGRLRFADLANGELDRAVQLLLGEPGGKGVEDGEAEASKVDAARVLKDALIEARGSKRRVLVHLGAPW